MCKLKCFLIIILYLINSEIFLIIKYTWFPNMTDQNLEEEEGKL